MKNRIALICVAAALLASCTDADWDHSLNYVGIGDGKPAPQRAVRRADAAPQMAQQQRQAAAPAQLAPQAPTVRPADPFCQSVATQDAQGNGFDQATQSRVYQTSYNQCVAMFAGGSR